MKKALLILLILIVIAGLAIFSIPRFIDWNRFKPDISVAFQGATAREMRIEGNLEVSVFPSLEVSLEKVHLSNVASSPNPDMVFVGSVRGKIDLLPLFSRKLVVDSVVITRPRIFLEVDEVGQSNWAFEPKTVQPSDHEGEPTARKDEPSILNFQLVDFRIEDGEIHYHNAATGQKVEAKNIAIKGALPDLRSPLTLSGKMDINDEPVTAEVSVSSVQNIASGERFTVAVALDSTRLKMRCDTTAQKQPTETLDGAFSLDVPSVRGIYSWLNHPLHDSQLDQGPLRARLSFASEGKRGSIKEAIVESAGIKLAVTGSYDGAGDVARLVLNVEGGAMDLDRYLPPTPEGRTLAARQSGIEESSRGIFTSISNEALDLSGLRKIDADVRVVLGGVKAAGLETGRVDLDARLKDAVLIAELKDFPLHGGKVKGTLKLDAAQDDLGVNSTLVIDGVSLERLAQASRDETPVATGIASGELSLTAHGASPRALLESVTGRGTFFLNSAGSKIESPQGISEIQAHMSLPGMEKQPTLRAAAVYKGETITLDMTLAPLREVLSGDQFTLQASVASRPISVRYDGGVQRRPAPGLNGTFDLEIPSVAVLAAWVDKPLEHSQRDPGSFKAHAHLTTDGEKVLLKEAMLEGKGLKAKATATVDASKTVPSFVANVDVNQADLDVYLPSRKEARERPTRRSSAKRPGSWSEEPFDLTPLLKANGKGVIHIHSFRYQDLIIPQGRILATLEDGVLKTTIEKLPFSGGELAATSTIAASRSVAQLDYEVSLLRAQAGPIFTSIAGRSRITGEMTLHAQGNARGRSEKELIQSLKGSGDFKITDGAIHGFNLASRLRNASTAGLDASSDESAKTDFSELSGTFTMTDGVLENRDLKMLASSVRISGGGRIPLPPRTADLSITATLIPPPVRQGGRDFLADLPIPITIQGPWANLQFRVDWESVLREAAKDPDRLRDLRQGLRKGGRGFGGDEPGPQAPGARRLRRALDFLPGNLKDSGLTESDQSEQGKTEAQEQEAPSMAGRPRLRNRLFGR